MRLNPIYVCAKDMRMAVRFYAKLFGAGPAGITDRFSELEVSGISLCLRSGDAMIFGNNCVPDFEAGYIEKRVGDNPRPWRRQSEQSIDIKYCDSGIPRGGIL